MKQMDNTKYFNLEKKIIKCFNYDILLSNLQFFSFVILSSFLQLNNNKTVNGLRQLKSILMRHQKCDNIFVSDLPALKKTSTK